MHRGCSQFDKVAAHLVLVSGFVTLGVCGAWCFASCWMSNTVLEDAGAGKRQPQASMDATVGGEGKCGACLGVGCDVGAWQVTALVFC